MRQITWHWADHVSNDRHFGTVADCDICTPKEEPDGQAATVQELHP